MNEESKITKEGIEKTTQSKLLTVQYSQAYTNLMNGTWHYPEFIGYIDALCADFYQKGSIDGALRESLLEDFKNETTGMFSVSTTTTLHVPDSTD
jgi:hypothetical protein